MSDVGGVVLAAGLSTRSGAFKMTLPLGEQTVIERCVHSMLHVVRRVRVVVGWNAHLVRAALSGVAGVEFVLNPRFREGMYSSVRAGVSSIQADRFFLIPGDMPLVSPEVYERMLAVEGEVVLPTYQGETGHPVLFAGRLAPEILDMPAGATLRDFAARGWKEVVVPDQGILIDMDTPADYDRVRVALLSSKP